MSTDATPALNAAGAYILRSLLEHPERSEPETIAEPDDAPGEGAVREALADLEARGLVERTADGWRATDAARAR